MRRILCASDDTPASRRAASAAAELARALHATVSVVRVARTGRTVDPLARAADEGGFDMIVAAPSETGRAAVSGLSRASERRGPGSRRDERRSQRRSPGGNAPPGLAHATRPR